jgi:tetratricopeptide (TPR) repeat protein
MKLKSLILAALIAFPASIITIIGQDSLIINNELKMKRFSDSVNAFNYYMKAEEFLQSNDSDSTLLYTEKSLTIATSADFPYIEACNYELLGSFYNRQADWERTLRYYLKALSLYERLNDYAKESSILRSIANWYYRSGVYKKSADYFERESALYGEDNLKMLGASSEMAANSYYNIENDTLAVKWFRKASGYYKKNGDMDGFLRCSEKLASLYIQEGLYNDALETYRMILPVYSEKGDFQNIAAIYNQTGFLLIKMNDPDAALAEFQMASGYSLNEGKDDFFLTDLWSNIGICYQNLGRQKEMLESFEMALECAKNSGRTDEVARIDRILGRIYFIKGDNYHIVLAAGDCTGHGVPGAFMSMLGLAFLDEIVNTVEVDNAAEILNLLRDEVISTLRQKGTVGETRDGMDISLFILDLNGGRLQFAGANNPLYLIRDNKLTKIQADRMPIGIHFTTFSPFTNNFIDISKGDFLCLFTDGYADQFGGSKGRKFMYRPFQKLLIDNHAKPVDLQKDILDKTFEEWKGDRDQVDDVLVIGLKI